MSKTLFLFVNSERPDSYLNSVVHCILNEDVRNVEFIHVPGSKDSKTAGQSVSATVQRLVVTLLEDLAASGKYRHLVGERSGEREDLRQIYSSERLHEIQGIYRRCAELGLNWHNRDVRYQDLRKEIRSIARKKPDSIVDVTAAKKGLLGDVIAAAVIEGLRSLHTFEMKARPDFDKPWTMLYHELAARESLPPGYEYVDIIDTPVFDECSRSLLVRRPSLISSVVVALVGLLVMLIAYFTLGEESWLVRSAFAASTVASLLSVVFTLFPPRGQ